MERRLVRVGVDARFAELQAGGQMSLLGSLEDLGLGDILEIIHLSQKSGVLSIRGEAGEGRLVFQAGSGEARES